MGLQKAILRKQIQNKKRIYNIIIKKILLERFQIKIREQIWKVHRISKKLFVIVFVIIKGQNARGTVAWYQLHGGYARWCISQECL